MTRTIPSQFLYELGTDFTGPVQEHQYYAETGNTGQTIPRFAAGQLVHHETFGLGTIKEFIDMGENSVVIVKFNTGQIKSLMLKYANLSKI